MMTNKAGRGQGRQCKHIANMKKNNITELLKEILKFRNWTEKCLLAE